MRLLLVLLLVAAVAAKDKKKANNKSQCASVMKKGGLSKDFAKHVSHAIHSLTVEDIRTYFNKNVGENNNIPVVNPMLRDQPRVLENAPIMGYDEEFVTDGMKHYDVIMKGVNMDGWHLTAFGLLERLSHVFHMSEIWAAAGKKYKKIANRGKVTVDSELCDCVRDMEENGLAKYLQLTALQIRYPGITSGNSTITDTYMGGFLDYHISYGLAERPKNLGQQLKTFDFDRTDEELIPDVIENLVDKSKFDEEPHDPEEEARTSREHWEWCVGELKGLLTDALLKDTATFMHCQLNVQ